MKGFVVAGTSTGVGKTTISAALLAAPRACGFAVQPFKCGPDYIDGRSHVMAAVLPLAVEMLDRLDGFGYTEVEVPRDCPVAPRGAKLRGHSFHYSRVTPTGSRECCYRTRRMLAGFEDREGYRAGNVLASYIHLNFAGSPEAAAHFVQNCRQGKAVAA